MTKYSLSVAREIKEIGVQTVQSKYGSVYAFAKTVWYCPEDQARMVARSFGE